MGIAISDWRLARAVSVAGQLGVVSGTALDHILVRRLQNGDPEGHVRRALRKFPAVEVAGRILGQYFVPGGIPDKASYRGIPLPTLKNTKAAEELLVVATFVEVFLAKENHGGVVGLNLLEKVQVCTLPSLYGAMLAGVDYVLMGAGIPRLIPGVLDCFATGLAAEMRIDVLGATDSDAFNTRFDPCSLLQNPPPLRRPRFLAVVSSSTLATTLARRSTGRVDGFVIEGEIAGGHNAPPRGPMQLSDAGEPIYGPRDSVDLKSFRQLGLPFWLAGAFSDPSKLDDAIAGGAAGIQVGSAFAFCKESGLDETLKAQALARIQAGDARVFTDPNASPTGFPFKVFSLEGTLSEADAYAQRERVCDVGLLRTPYRKDDGSVGYRCPAEPQDDYVRKGGDASETLGRKCLCNALLATAGFPQRRPDAEIERALVTSGRDLSFVTDLTQRHGSSYSAADVINRALRTA